MRHSWSGLIALVAWAAFHHGALAQDQTPSKGVDPTSLLQSACVAHKAVFDDVLAYAKSTGWRVASAGAFPIPGAFQETAILQSPDTNDLDGILLYVGHANFPHQASSDVCMIGVRPGNYDDLRAKIQTWIGTTPSKQDPMGVAYAYQEIGGVRKNLPITTDQANRDAAFKNGPVYGVAVGHSNGMVMLLYSVTTHIN